MPKHENNALQNTFYNQFEQGTFSVECAQAWGTLDMSMGTPDQSIKRWVACTA